MIVFVHRIFALVITALVGLPTSAADFTVCRRNDGKAACVYDGDTFWLDREKIRTLGYDAPEMGWPFCDGAAAGAEAARERLRALLNSGAAVGIERQAIDPYGRTLAWVTIGGQSLAAIMIREGHGRPWIEGGEHWC